jgi:branched-chain amino acid transport system permease protein
MVQFIAQGALNALALGVIYSLIALGLTLIISIMRIVNFAHGQLYMLGAFALYLLFKVAHLDFFTSLAVAIILIACLGIILERLFFRRLRGNEAGCMLLSLGLALVLESGALLLFGEDDKGVVSPFSGALEIGGLFLGKDRVAAILISLCAIVCLFLFLHKTKMGRAIRAFAQDNDAAVLQGINIEQLSWIGFAIGSGLAALAGGLLAPIYWINPFIGGDVIINALVVMVIGGLGSIPGTLLGGVILGVIDSFGSQFLPGTWAQAISYSLVVVVLIVRPRGLMGHAE